MLPPYLLGNYKRYKADTDRFIGWILETATAYGGDTVRNQNKAETTRTDQGSDSTTLRRLSLCQVLVLAKQIASSASNIKVPAEIVKAAKRAISLRKECCEWYGKNVEAESTSNVQHLHFVSVLEEVLQILGVSGTCASPPEQPSSSIGKKLDVLHSLGSRFSALDIEEINEQEASSSDNDLPGSKTKDKQNTSFVLCDNEDDEEAQNHFAHAVFAIQFLFYDLQKIRWYVAQTWQAYKENTLDIMTAAVTTNTAIETARDMISEFKQSDPIVIKLLKEYNKLGDCFSLILVECVAKERGEESTPLLSASDPYNFNLADIVEASYLRAHKLITSVTQRLQLCPSFPSVPQAEIGRYDPNADWVHMDERQRFHEDGIILAQILTVFAQPKQLDVAILKVDEISRGLRAWIDRRFLPLWLSFGVQLFLDINLILRDKIRKGYQDTRLNALRVRKTLSAYLSEKERVGRGPFWPDEMDSGIDRILRDIAKYVEPAGSKAAHSQEVSGSEEGRYTFLLNWHPVLAGILTFNINLRTQELGLQLVNLYSSSTNLAYMYNFIKESDVATLNWPDIEKLIDIHGENYVFLGARPRSLEDSINKLNLALGVSLQSVATRKEQRKRDKKPTSSEKGARTLQNSISLANVFMERYCQSKPISLSQAHIEQVLREFSDKNDAKYDDSGKQPRQKPKRHWDKNKQLSPLQLLTILRSYLIESEHKLIFDYFGLHHRCIDILLALRTKLDGHLTQYFGANYLEHDFMIACIVGFILSAAEAVDDALKKANPKNKRAGEREPYTSNYILLSAGKIMHDYLEKNGNVACKELKVFCKNKSTAIPEKMGETKKSAHATVIPENEVETKTSAPTMLIPEKRTDSEQSAPVKATPGKNMDAKESAPAGKGKTGWEKGSLKKFFESG